jgi:DnaJ-class molecular chaperone
VTQHSPDDFYQRLRIRPDATSEQIKSAYRQLARQFHPDTNPDNPQAEEHFKSISEAYATLSDAKKRQQYHEEHPQLKQKSNRPPPPAPPPPKPTAKQPAYDPIKDMFDALLKGATEARQKEVVRKKQQSLKGQNITVQVSLSAIEAKQGSIKTLTIEHEDACKRCSETGRLNGLPCPVCHGKGHLHAKRKLDVKIPAGIQSGSKIRLAGEGEKNTLHSQPGDIFIEITVLSSQKSFKIEGLTVSSEVSLALYDAVLGCQREVETVHGPVSLTIPALTPSGKVFKLKHQGVHQGVLKGDHLVTVLHALPVKLTPEIKALYQELKRHDDKQAGA